MIKYEKFFFAAPPKTGSTFFIKAAAEIGLGDAQKAELHIPPPLTNWSGFLVSTVRHPYEFLCSYYLSLKGGATGVACVDVLMDHARTSLDADEFVSKYLKHCPGEVGKIFDRYRANSVLRLEDFPWNIIEFFETIGVQHNEAWKISSMTPQNARKGHPHIVNKDLRKQVVIAEKDICERYEYY